MVYQTREEGEFKYIEEGTGNVLLLLHGLFGSLSNWQRVIQYFSSRYKVIAPSLPLYDMPLRATGIKALAEFVYKFVEYKQLRNFALLGNSLGGHVGLIYAIHHPDPVRSIVLTGSSGLYENTLGGAYPRTKNYDYVKERTEYTFYDPAIASKELVDEVYATLNNNHKSLRVVVMAKSAIRNNMEKELHKIKCPVLLVWGKNDKITPPEVAEEFQRLLPDAELNWIDKCGHSPMMEQSEEFNEYVDRFLKRIY